MDGSGAALLLALVEVEKLMFTFMFEVVLRVVLLLDMRSCAGMDVEASSWLVMYCRL